MPSKSTGSGIFVRKDAWFRNFPSFLAFSKLSLWKNFHNINTVFRLFSSILLLRLQFSERKITDSRTWKKDFWLVSAENPSRKLFVKVAPRFRIFEKFLNPVQEFLRNENRYPKNGTSRSAQYGVPPGFQISDVLN